MTEPFDPFATFRNLSIELVRELAWTPYSEPLTGTWALISPRGVIIVADSPLACLAKERLSRIPPRQQLARIFLETVGERRGDLHDEG